MVYSITREKGKTSGTKECDLYWVCEILKHKGQYQIPSIAFNRIIRESSPVDPNKGKGSMDFPIYYDTASLPASPDGILSTYYAFCKDTMKYHESNILLTSLFNTHRITHVLLDCISIALHSTSSPGLESFPLETNRSPTTFPFH